MNMDSVLMKGISYHVIFEELSPKLTHKAHLLTLPWVLTDILLHGPGHS